MRHFLSALAGPVVAAVVGAAALGSMSAAASTPSPVATSTARVELVSTSLGKVLAGGSGRTLYIFGKDKGSKSECSGACAKAWPPLTTTGKPRAGRGISASKLGITNRGHGVKQATYHGHPLYLFSMDHKARQTNGEGINAFGGTWHAVSAAGKKA